MNDDDGVFQRLRARGEAVLTQVSNELLSNPQFAKVMQHAMRGKEKIDAAAARALKTMNVPTRTEFKKAIKRIEALEAELSALKAASAAPKPRASGRSRKKAP